MFKKISKHLKNTTYRKTRSATLIQGWLRTGGDSLKNQKVLVWFGLVFNQLLFLLCSLELLYLETPFSFWRKVLLPLVLWCKALVWQGRAKSGSVLCAQGQIGLSNDLCIKRTTSSVWRDEKTNTDSDTLCLRCFSVVNSCRIHITHDVYIFLFAFMWICFH